MAAPIVTLSGVGKSFASGVTAVDDLNLSVRQGEFLTLLGPSGCGKSTVLRIVAGLAAPTRGEVTWPDADVTSPRGRANAIGFVFQEPTLMPWADIAANVRLPLTLQHVARDVADPRAAAVLEQVGLAAFAKAYPQELSGGMKMRASIARALVTEPTLLLMDEPFAALDEITRFKLNNDLLAVWQQLGKTVIFVTHSVFESVFLSERIVVLTPRPGRVFREIAIDAPFPRDNTFRTSAAYAGFCRLVSETLAEAMDAEAAA